jgi:hypothetical protein
MSCGYQGYEFGSGSYPDSLCHEGYLADADADLEISEIPCPNCNSAQWLHEYREVALEGGVEDMSPAMVWEAAVRRLLKVNEVAALRALKDLTPFEIPDWQDRAGVLASTADPDVLVDRLWPWRMEGLSGHQQLVILSIGR